MREGFYLSNGFRPSSEPNEGRRTGDGPTSSNGSSRADDELTPSPGDELTPSPGDELTPSSGSGRGIWVGGTGGASQAVPERLDSVEF